MAERTTARKDEADGRRGEPPRPERPQVDAPPELSTAQLAFPWASALTLGAGPTPARPLTPRTAPTAPRRRRPVAE